MNSNNLLDYADMKLICFAVCGCFLQLPTSLLAALFPESSTLEPGRINHRLYHGTVLLFLIPTRGLQRTNRVPMAILFINCPFLIQPMAYEPQMCCNGNNGSLQAVDIFPEKYQFDEAIEKSLKNHFVLWLYSEFRTIHGCEIEGSKRTLQVQLFVGIWSAKGSSTYGRRRPFISLGSLVISFALIIVWYSIHNGYFIGETKGYGNTSKDVVLYLTLCAIVTVYCASKVLIALKQFLRLSDMPPLLEDPKRHGLDNSKSKHRESPGDLKRSKMPDSAYEMDNTGRNEDPIMKEDQVKSSDG